MNKFKFYDEDIESNLSHATEVVNGLDDTTEVGFILTIRGTEILLTEAELHYMQDEINKLK